MQLQSYTLHAKPVVVNQQHLETVLNEILWQAHWYTLFATISNIIYKRTSGSRTGFHLARERRRPTEKSVFSL
jgi:hypothetical protein